MTEVLSPPGPWATPPPPPPHPTPPSLPLRTPSPPPPPNPSSKDLVRLCGKSSTRRSPRPATAATGQRREPQRLHGLQPRRVDESCEKAWPPDRRQFRNGAGGSA